MPWYTSGGGGGGGAPAGAVDNSVLAGTGPETSTWATSGVGIGTGDSATFYIATTGSQLDISRGTAASPDTTTDPPLKVSRTMTFADTDVIGDGADECAAILGVNIGTSTCQVQAVGVMGSALNSSTVGGTVPYGHDACGLYGAARITGAGTGQAIGAFIWAQRNASTGKCLGLEVKVNNLGVAVPYNAPGITDSLGIFLHCMGSANSACGIFLDNPVSVQYDVGIGFSSQNGGPSASSSIRDDSTAPISLDIRGSHATAAINIESGNIVFGTGTGSMIGTAATQKLSFYGATPIVRPANTTDLKDALINLGLLASGGATELNLDNGSLYALWAYTSGITLGSNPAQSGTIRLPNNNWIAWRNAANSADINGIKINASNQLEISAPAAFTGTIGFNATAPIAKPTVTGAKGSNAALASLLTALASYGLVTDSSTA